MSLTSTFLAGRIYRMATNQLLTTGAIAVLQILQALGFWAHAQREVHLRFPRAGVREQSQAYMRRKPRELQEHFFMP